MNARSQGFVLFVLTLIFCLPALGSWTITAPGATFSTGGVLEDYKGAVVCSGSGDTGATCRAKAIRMADTMWHAESPDVQVDSMTSAWSATITPGSAWLNNEWYVLTVEQKVDDVYGLKASKLSKGQDP
jgi:hypothetical protein